MEWQGFGWSGGRFNFKKNLHGRGLDQFPLIGFINFLPNCLEKFINKKIHLLIHVSIFHKHTVLLIRIDIDCT